MLSLASVRRSISSPDEERPADDGARWYLVHTYSGHEDKACSELMKRVEFHGIGKYILDAQVPKQTVVKITDKGEQRAKDETMYRGYLLVKMREPSDVEKTRTASTEIADFKEMTVGEHFQLALSIVRGTSSIINFIMTEDERDGSRRPVPLLDDEAHKMIYGGRADDPKINFGYDVGDVVTITDGPFNEFSGTVDAVQADRGVVQVTVSFFGQDTPVELSFTSVEKA